MSNSIFFSSIISVTHILFMRFWFMKHVLNIKQKSSTVPVMSYRNFTSLPIFKYTDIFYMILKGVNKFPLVRKERERKPQVSDKHFIYIFPFPVNNNPNGCLRCKSLCSDRSRGHPWSSTRDLSRSPSKHNGMYILRTHLNPLFFFFIRGPRLQGQWLRQTGHEVQRLFTFSFWYLLSRIDG